MELSICLDPRRPWTETSSLASAAEAAGLCRVYVCDHFMGYAPGREAPPGDVHEGWTTLSAIAAVTSRIGLGTLVLGNTYRHPAVVANMAAALDAVSEGRLLLGLGAGWQENEHAAYGIDLPPVGQRLDRFEEAVQVILALLRTDSASFTGRYYRLVEARCEPKPVQRPLPLLLGGGGERRSIPIAARYADVWHAWTDPEEFRRKSAVLDVACTAAGRQPSEVRRLTGQVLRVVPGSPARADDVDVIGPPDHVAGRLAAYQDAGVDEFVIRDHAEASLADSLNSVEALASDVVPQLHRASDR